MKVLSPAISGCKVALLEDGFVKKWTEDVDYIARLKSQAEKQNRYHNENTNENILIPYVTTMKHNYFIMQYVPYMGYVDFIETSGIEKVKQSLYVVLGFIRNNLQGINVYDFSVEDLVEREINKRAFPQEYRWIGTYIKDHSEEVPLPVGKCHGDFTLSNILFDNGKIGLIDFNDVPIDSPVIDLIKLRQDTKFHWTSFMSRKKCDYKKVQLTDDWLNVHVNGMMLNFDINIRDYKYWEALNYLRIFRNVKEKNVYEYLVNNIKEILR